MTSTAMLVSKGMRVAGVLSFSSNLIDCQFLFKSCVYQPARSTEKPTHSFCLLIYPNGGEAVRVPTVKTPVR